MKNIQPKNYIIYMCICVITLILMLLFVKFANSFVVLKKSVLSGFLYEITEQDIISNLKNYAIDNPCFFLYISNDNNILFDKNFKQFLINNNLGERFVYINGFSKMNNNFAKKFKDNFFKNDLIEISVDSVKYSNIYLFENGYVVDILYRKKMAINLNDVEKYLEDLGELNND